MLEGLNHRYEPIQMPALPSKLGNFVYANACPRCHIVLDHNQLRESPAKPSVPKPKSWPVRAFARIMRFVES